jgi:uncharacterized protein (DUF4213/DUF364 family)
MRRYSHRIAMGKQIQHILTLEDEEKLIRYLKEKYSIQVVNGRYPRDWDRKTLTKSQDSKHWVIIDERVIDIVIESSNQLQSN